LITLNIRGDKVRRIYMKGGKALNVLDLSHWSLDRLSIFSLHTRPCFGRLKVANGHLDLGFYFYQLICKYTATGDEDGFFFINHKR